MAVSEKKHRLGVAAWALVPVLPAVIPMVVREPTAGHIIFGVVLLLVCPTIVYLIGAAAAQGRQKPSSQSRGGNTLSSDHQQNGI